MVIFKARAHWRTLAAPALVTIVLIVLGFVLTLQRLRLDSVPHYGAIIWGLIAIGWVAGGLIPFLKWLMSTDTLTENQLRSDEGIISRQSTTIPLERVAATNVERSALDRVFRSGTIQVQTAGSDSTVELWRVPQVLKLEAMINEQVKRYKAAGGPGD